MKVIGCRVNATRRAGSRFKPGKPRQERALGDGVDPPRSSAAPLKHIEGGEFWWQR